MAWYMNAYDSARTDCERTVNDSDVSVGDAVCHHHHAMDENPVGYDVSKGCPEDIAGLAISDVLDGPTDDDDIEYAGSFWAQIQDDPEDAWRDCSCGCYRPSSQAWCECGSGMYWGRRAEEPHPPDFV